MRDLSLEVCKFNFENIENTVVHNMVSKNRKLKQSTLVSSSSGKQLEKRNVEKMKPNTKVELYVFAFELFGFSMAVARKS